MTSMAPGKNKAVISSPSKLTSCGVPMVGLVLVTRHCEDEWLSILSVWTELVGNICWWGIYVGVFL